MFGVGKKRKFKKAANKLGMLIHRQITDALVNHKQLFDTSEAKAFTSGYLKSFIWDGLNRQGCDDMELQHELLRDTCNKVSPDSLWEIYESGEASAEPEAASYKAGCITAYELGVTAGLNDTEEGAINKVTPENLTRYLSGNNLEGPAFVDEDAVQFKADPNQVDKNQDG